MKTFALAAFLSVAAAVGAANAAPFVNAATQDQPFPSSDGSFAKQQAGQYNTANGG